MLVQVDSLDVNYLFQIDLVVLFILKKELTDHKIMFFIFFRCLPN